MKRREISFSNHATNSPVVPLPEGRILSVTEPTDSQNFSTELAIDSASPANLFALSRNVGSICLFICFFTLSTAWSTAFSVSATAFCAVIFFIGVFFVTVFFTGVFFAAVVVLLIGVFFSGVAIRTRKIKLLFCSRTIDKIKKKEGDFWVIELT